MSKDISCVINAHREGNVLFPTIKSVKRAVAYAADCGLDTETLVILDNADSQTEDLVYREFENTDSVHEVMFKDLSHSRNYAITTAAGRYTAFVDGDDLWGETWLVDAFLMAERCDFPVVLHPEYNIFFGDENAHVFNHVDMDAADFEFESLYRMNYWTALSFAKTSIYQAHPYSKNIIMEGFGYEDWTWNYETIKDGIKHKVVPGTVHYIRKGRPQDSLLARTNDLNALPRILDIYRQLPSLTEFSTNDVKSVTRIDEVENDTGPVQQSNAA